MGGHGPSVCSSGVSAAPFGGSALSSSKPRHGEAKELFQAPRESRAPVSPLEPRLCGPGPVTLHPSLLPRWACLLLYHPPHGFTPCSRLGTQGELLHSPLRLQGSAEAQHQGGCHSLGRYFGTFPRARAEPGQARGQVRSGLGLAIPRHVARQLRKATTGNDRAGAVS